MKQHAAGGLVCYPRPSGGLVCYPRAGGGLVCYPRASGALLCYPRAGEGELALLPKHAAGSLALAKSKRPLVCHPSSEACSLRACCATQEQAAGLRASGGLVCVPKEPAAGSFATQTSTLAGSFATQPSRRRAACSWVARASGGLVWVATQEQAAGSLCYATAGGKG